MSILGWIIAIAGAFGIGVYASRVGWSKLKQGGACVLLWIICSTIFGGGGDGGLKKASQEYVLQRLKSPSTATFLSYANSDDFGDFLKNEYNLNLKDNCDAVMIEVESTNGFGGRVRNSFIVFFRDGEAVDMIDADADFEKVRAAVNYLDLI